MERSQFTFYDSFHRALQRIKSKAARCDVYDAICEYALYGTEPNLEKLPDSAAIAFELVRPNLDASRRKAESGKKGGSKKQDESKTEANDKQTESKKKNKKENKIENKIENKCIKENFALFWEAYPRKEGMAKAEEVFADIDVPVDVLLEAIEAQKISPLWLRDGGMFIPHASRWLEEKRWLDKMAVTPNGAKGQMGAAEMDAIAKLMAVEKVMDHG